MNFLKFHCIFFSANTELHISQNDEEGDYAWLEKIKTPDDLYILQGRYMGPVIQP